jgi:6-phosphogluconolactonase
VYVINEIASTMSAFAYDGAHGAMQMLQTVSTLPEGFGGRSSCAQIVAHPSGRFVYGSNRGHDSIAIFAVDEATGRLTLAGHEPARGKTPRNFNLDPGGAFLYAANQDSDTIVAFRIDAQTGRLTPTGQVIENPSPVCVIFHRRTM